MTDMHMHLLDVNQNIEFRCYSELRVMSYFTFVLLPQFLRDLKIPKHVENPFPIFLSRFRKRYFSANSALGTNASAHTVEEVAYDPR